MALSDIRVEDEIFTQEGTRGVGAVRAVHPGHLDAYFEGYGDLELRAENIRSAHDGKVLVDPTTLPADLQDRLPKIHDGETRA